MYNLFGFKIKEKNYTSVTESYRENISIRLLRRFMVVIFRYYRRTRVKLHPISPPYKAPHEFLVCHLHSRPLLLLLTLCFLLIDKARAKGNTYIWVSVQ